MERQQVLCGGEGRDSHWKSFKGGMDEQSQPNYNKDMAQYIICIIRI